MTPHDARCTEPAAGLRLAAEWPERRSRRRRALTALPARALETVLWTESERMAFTLGRLDETALQLEKRIVTNELHEREQTRSFVLRRRSGSPPNTSPRMMSRSGSPAGGGWGDRLVCRACDVGAGEGEALSE
jgi:hypothetical protein